ncbi:glutamyl-tRNA amidotransferase [Chloroflexia bacterium SDU3-3]|nr:glutamyl-tRNA amidotransferase [Chloroflexia bacterium SDU3-3]
MALQEQLQNDLKAAMRSGDKRRVEVIRMAMAAIKNAHIAQLKQAYDASAAAATDESTIELDHTAMSDEAALDVLKKESKRRREAAEVYRSANRADLAEAEEAEGAILDSYLPRQLTADELRPLVAEFIAGLGVASPSEMGKIMPALMKEFKTKADGRVINQVAREVLSSK